MEDSEWVWVDRSLWWCDWVGLTRTHPPQSQSHHDLVVEASGTFFLEAGLALEDGLEEDDSSLLDQSQTNLRQNCCGGNWLEK